MQAASSPTAGSGGGAAGVGADDAAARRPCSSSVAGVSLLWPLPSSSADGSSLQPSALPDNVIGAIMKLVKKRTRIYGEHIGFRNLRLVSRAARDAVDARVRTLSTTYQCQADLAEHMLARFPGLRTVGVFAVGAFAGAARGLPSLRRLRDLSVHMGVGHPAIAMEPVAALARALPTLRGLQTLTLSFKNMEDEDGGFSELLVEATGAIGSLRSLRMTYEFGACYWDSTVKEWHAVRRALEHPGAWGNLQVRLVGWRRAARALCVL